MAGPRPRPYPPVNAFVATVLLRIARLDAFDAYGRPQPPDGEFAQVELCSS
jgi:hypothetical protein